MMELQTRLWLRSSQRCLGPVERQIRTVCRNGELYAAANILSHVSTALTDGTYKLLLQACLKKKALAIGKEIHAHLTRHTPNFSSSLREHFVLLFTKCGALEDACNIFHTCTNRTVLSWTAMISGFVEAGRHQESFQFYECMKCDNVEPNHYTFVALLKACGSISDIERGRRLHEELRKTGLLSNLHVFNTLVSMYGKCQSLSEAETVFQSGVVQQDIVSWNAMLSAYIDLEKGCSALRLFRQMHEEGVSPDSRTLILALSACNHNNDQSEFLEEESRTGFSSDIVESLHADAKKLGFLSNTFLISMLVSMYGKVKSILRAENMFGTIQYPDIVQWNALITAYLEVGQAINALQVFLQLNKEGMNPDQHTYVLALQGCCALAEKEWSFSRESVSANCIALKIGEGLRLDARKQGYSANAFLSTSLISLYSKCDAMTKAETTFQEMEKRRSVCWNSMLSAYVEQGEGENALQLYSEMQKKGVKPDVVTLVVAIQACCILVEREVARNSTCTMSLKIGRGLHNDARRGELDTDEWVANTLINMYGKCGAICDAEEIFAKLSTRSVVSWNSLVTAFVEQGLADKAALLFWQMQKLGIKMNESTFISILHASNMTGWAELCKKVHFSIVTEGYDFHSSLITTLIHAYGACALIQDAQAVFTGFFQYDSVLCSAYLDALVQNGNFNACIQVFRFMKLIGLEPDCVTYFSLLSGCSHAGVVDIGLQCFELMATNGHVLELRHYAIMTDLLGRAGNFGKLQKILAAIQPDVGIWSTLLGICRFHGNTKVGKWAFDHVVRMRPKEVSAYILMWNIFADAGMHDCAKQIDLLRQLQGVEKVCLECDEI